MRNRMGHNPLKVYANDVLCFTPGLTREFWTTAAAIPYSEKWDFNLYFRLFREQFPEALRTPFCSAGRLWSDRLRLDPFQPRVRFRQPVVQAGRDEGGALGGPRRRPPAQADRRGAP